MNGEARCAKVMLVSHCSTSEIVIFIISYLDLSVNKKTKKCSNSVKKYRIWACLTFSFLIKLILSENIINAMKVNNEKKLFAQF